MMKNNVILQIDGLTQVFKNGKKQKEVLKNISFELEKGEILCIIGESGCGKSTLLRIIAGFLTPTSGQIVVNGEKLKKPTRNVMYLQQDYNQLFPWLDVVGNIKFTLSMMGYKGKELENKINEYIHLVELDDCKDMYPYQLSGGQKQRVAFARVLSLNPDLILMDEPFAALDYNTKASLQKSTKEIIKKMKNTVLFVTHHINEALFLADKMLVLGKNKYVFIDNPKDYTKDQLLELY